MGSPATILNSSQNTNFEYIVENLDLRYINEINRIQSKTKLLERIHAILTYGGIIRFNKVLSAVAFRIVGTPDHLFKLLLGS